MALPKRRRERFTIKVCGLIIPTEGGAQTYGGGNLYPGARIIGSFAWINKATAKRLAGAFGFRQPRPGYEMQICKDVWLRRRGHGFEVTSRQPGGFRGVRKRSR